MLSKTFNPFTLSRGLSRRFFGSRQEIKVVNRVLPYGSQEHRDLWDRSTEMFELSLTHRQTCDIELLLNGGFSPLEGFMTQQVYDSVVETSHLPSDVSGGAIWPMPICLDVTAAQALAIEQSGAKQIVLRDEEHNPIAVMDVEDIYRPDKQKEGELVFGGDPEHPAIEFLRNMAGEVYIGGRLQGLQLPRHYDYRELRRTPEETRALFAERGWDKVCAFQTRNPMHRAHIELTLQALQQQDMNLMIHPVVGMTKPGDIDHHTRVKCYQAIMDLYPQERTCLSVFPLAMRMGGPREAIWHCLIRRNYGATHFILGRDHAGPGSNSKGEDFYSGFAARDAAVAVQDETGIQCLSFEMMVYSPEDDKYYPQNAVPEGKKVLKLSGTEVRRRLRTGEDIPAWFSYPRVVEILRNAHPARHKQGFTLFFTGLSGSGKSTIANALLERLMELDTRKIAMLDGDYVRKLISSELTFSKEHRNLNIKRIGFISALINNAGGICIAAPIAPYEESRSFARGAVSEVGAFIEVFISTPVDTCADRDVKGLYAKAKRNEINLTGVGDEPYEEPTNAEIVIDTTGKTVESCVDQIVDYLAGEGFLKLEGMLKEL